MPRVLVTGGEERAVLAAVRCLAAHGWEPTVAAHAVPAAAQWSRACAARVRVPDPAREPEAFVDALARALAAREHAVLLPGTDAALLAISAGRARLEPLARIGLPPEDVVRAAVDKAALAEAAAAAGLPGPEGAVCAGETEAVAAASALGYPVVAKPRRSTFRDGARVRQSGGRRVEDEAALRALLGGSRAEWVLQRAEPGALHSVSGVMAAGRLRAVAVSRYLRTWPVRSGNAAAAVTLAAPDALVAAVERLLAGLGWEGLFELELLRAPGGPWRPIDLNPRPFGSLALVVAAGAPLPALWCDRLVGREPAWASARPGVRYRWEDAELRHALWRARHGELRAAAAVLRPRRGTVHAHLRADDPAPFMARALYLASRTMRR
jgi:predicted ATP-grasp superfamily ATP-dependent carboligase